jgi:hypothetical protein
MKDEKVTFEMVFPIEPYRNFKLGIEGSVEPNETYEEAAQKAYDKVMSQGNVFLEKLTGPTTISNDLKPYVIPVEKPIPEQERIEALIQDIKAETVLRKEDGTGGLLAWRLLVEKHPALKPAYDEMLIKLSK